MTNVYLKPKHELLFHGEVATRKWSASCVCSEWSMSAIGPGSFRLHKPVFLKHYEEHVRDA